MDGICSAGLAVETCFSAVLTSAMLWNLCAGCLAMHRVTMAAIGDSSGRGSSRTTAFRMSSTELPLNGRLPDSISYSTAPKLNTSERSSSGLPWACSGDM